MILKANYKQKYTLDREPKELVVEVKLKQRDGLIPAGQNIWYGIAIANEKEIRHKGLANCVNAQYMAETIALEIIARWKVRAKKEGKNFRLKHDKKKKKK